MESWLKKAVADSLLGSCPKSHRRFLSGLAAWQDFARRNLGIADKKQLPPTLNGLLAWSRTFSYEGAFSNYLNFVKLACQLEGVSSDVFNAPELVRAKRSLKKAEPPREPKRFIRHDVIAKMIAYSSKERCPATWLAVRLFATAYTFQLRLPSEALPIAIGRIGEEHVGQHAVLNKVGNELHLQLQCRKTHQADGSLIRRACWCNAHKETCPVHVLWPDLNCLTHGTQPWAWLTPATALASLRETLGQLGVPGHQKYGTHSLRKGHTMDLAEDGKLPEEVTLVIGSFATVVALSLPGAAVLRTVEIEEEHEALPRRQHR